MAPTSVCCCLRSWFCSRVVFVSFFEHSGLARFGWKLRRALGYCVEVLITLFSPRCLNGLPTPPHSPSPDVLVFFDFPILSTPDVFISPWPRRLVALCGKTGWGRKKVWPPRACGVLSNQHLFCRSEMEKQRERLDVWRAADGGRGRSSTMSQRRENQESGHN